ncbi:hypothetical protein PPL_09463 [Heterostelium album PN500]|uniref:N-acetyltransferase domain-containing protein n=1 Tax=Heterostelium pallidum (strain ATCC 26659 / Pp 5 / PN500) TaxID=670386 RepID=D3BPJ4_HETP5|nr:hypothetical protein PPL_09463 [Heterostelium album PN500]EFA76712.1 hypothetical protein PPL_09463 [Heterostelium album PN500]|eukprot:XP_020428844.1 hypothetical protein PPL_09463 [Heterostelium album PN500]
MISTTSFEQEKVVESTIDQLSTTSSSNEEIVIERINEDQAWNIRHIVMYPEMPFDFIKMDTDPDSIHFGLHLKSGDNKILISVISLVLTNLKDGDVQFRKFATLEQYQRKGYGSKLMFFTVEQAKQMGCKRLWCNARSAKSPFYNNFGFKTTGSSWNKNGYDYIIMESFL